MVRCIICGGEVKLNPNGNDRCLRCDETWDTTELKDNQDWNVRHTRALEQRVQTLEQQIKELLELMKR